LHSTLPRTLPTTRPARRRLRALAATIAFAFALTAADTLLAGAASAHVTVNPRQATQGGYEKLVFRVPNESDTAGTVKLVVHFPQDTPFSAVRVKPHVGWDAKIEKKKLDKPVESNGATIDEAVDTVTWTAKSGTRIAPGEFDEFEISAGPLPTADSISLPAVQSYDDGTEVAWDQEATEGAEEPEHPAPVLKLVAAAGSGSDAKPAANTEAASDSADGSDGTARALGIAGLIVGALGLGVGALAVTRSRRQGA
jgi:uncharacterized protein YcnI